MRPEGSVAGYGQCGGRAVWGREGETSVRWVGWERMADGQRLCPRAESRPQAAAQRPTAPRAGASRCRALENRRSMPQHKLPTFTVGAPTRGRALRGFRLPSPVRKAPLRRRSPAPPAAARRAIRAAAGTVPTAGSSRETPPAPDSFPPPPRCDKNRAQALRRACATLRASPRAHKEWRENSLGEGVGPCRFW